MRHGSIPVMDPAKYTINESNKKNVVLFDGMCNLCSGIVKFIETIDKKHFYKFTSLQSTHGQNLLEKFNINKINNSTFVLILGEEYFIKSTAALRLFKELGGIWKLLYLFILLPRPLRDLFYDAIAKTRYKLFGKRDTCLIP